MRYTTLIDISEIPSIYKSQSTRLLYMHLALKAGYHNEDKDIIRISLRTLAREVGLTMGATRYALKRLIDAQLLTLDGEHWKVKKWILEQPITPRPKTIKAQKDAEIRAQDEAERMQRLAKMEEEEKKRQQLMKKTGKTSFMLYYESQEAKANAGDVEAAEYVRRNKAGYEEHVKQWKANILKEKEAARRKTEEAAKENELKRKYGIEE